MMSTSTRLFISCLAYITAVYGQQTYTIDPNSVPLSLRNAWCQSQITQCPLICTQYNSNTTVTRANDCDAENLTYSCICANGKTPNVSEYSLTLPYYICQEWGNQCVADCGNDNTCASNCRTNHPCGAQNPTRVTTSKTQPAGHTATPKGGDDGYTGFADGTGEDNGASSLCPGGCNMKSLLKWLGILLLSSLGYAVGF